MNLFKKKEVFDKDKIAIIPDHFSPTKDIKSAEQCKVIRDFSREKNIKHYYEVGKMGGVMPTVYNAANEKAVAMFLKEKIRFNDIYRIIADCVEHFENIENPSVEVILEYESEVYQYIEERI